MIKELANEYPVVRLCSALMVTRGGYYAWLKRGKGVRRRDDEELLTQIRAIFTEHEGNYGSPRVHGELLVRDRHCSCKRVARLMRIDRLVAKPKRSFVITTESDASAPVAPNLLARRFAPGGPAVWLADITYVRTWEGFLYLAVVMKLSSRRVIGFSMATTLAGQLSLDALQMALDQAGPVPGLMHHSDRGGHYTAKAYQDLLAQHAIRVSMSRKGNCYDNAPIESLFRSMKREEFDGNPPRTFAEAKSRIFEYFEVYYNRKRLHSSLGYLSPVVYERRLNNL